MFRRGEEKPRAAPLFQRKPVDGPPTPPNPPRDDADLLRAPAWGDHRAFHALVDRHGDALYRAALSYTRGHAADAEDLLQQTLICAFRGAGTFAGRASVRTWMLRILMREAGRAWRRSQDRPHATPLDPGIAATTPPPSARVEQRLDIETVLGELSDMHREVLVMREIWDMSYDEIAAALEIPRGTVESRLSRAREQFRRRFEGGDHDEQR